MSPITDLFKYIQEVNFFILTVVLIVLFLVLLGVIIKTKNPKFAKPLLYACVSVFAVWFLILVLTITGIFPIYEEVFVSSECCAYFTDAPSLATKLIATLPFIGVALWILSFVSKKVSLKNKNRRSKHGI